MQRNVLDAQEIFSRRHVLGNVDAERGLVEGRPGQAIGGGGRLFGVYLEPGCAGAVPGGGGLAGGDSGVC